MIDLHEGVEEDLHVAGDLDRRLLDEDQIVRVHFAQAVGDRTEIVLERLAVAIQIDEVELADRLAANLDQRAAGHVEVDEIALVAQVHEFAARVVRPAMVLAGDAARLAGVLGDDRRAAMPARVVEAANLPVFAADEEQRFAQPVPAHVAADVGHLVAVERVDPALVPEVLPLQRGEVGIHITAAGNVGEARKTLGRGGSTRLEGVAGENLLDVRRIHHAHHPGIRWLDDAPSDTSLSRHLDRVTRGMIIRKGYFLYFAALR
jgi:hypothetical protein